MGPRPTEIVGSEKWNANNISCELFLKWKLLVFNGTFSEISHQNEANSLCLQTTTKKNVKIFSLRRCKHGMLTDVKFVNFFFLYIFNAIQVCRCVFKKLSAPNEKRMIILSMDLHYSLWITNHCGISFRYKLNRNRERRTETHTQSQIHRAHN